MDLILTKMWSLLILMIENWVSLNLGEEIALHHFLIKRKLTL